MAATDQLLDQLPRTTTFDAADLLFVSHAGTAYATPAGTFRGPQGVGISGIAKTGSSGLVDTYTVTLTDGTTATFTVTNGEQGEQGEQGVQGETGNGIASATLNSDYTLTLTYTNGQTQTVGPIRGEPGEGVTDLNPPQTASGLLVTFTSAAAGNPVNPLIVNIEPVQSGSGDPSPENIRPITGWTGATVTLSPTQDAADGTVYTISFGSAGTVYGGTLDVARGLLKVQSVMYQLLSSDTWTAVGSPNVVYRTEKRNTQITGGNQTCSHFKFNRAITTSNNELGFRAYNYTGSTTAAFQVRPGIETISTLEDWVSWLTSQEQNGTPLQCVVELSEPVTYQLTPQEVKTLLGVNNLWADCGDVSATYRTGTESPVMTADDIGVAGGAASYYAASELEARVAALEAALANS